MNPVVHWELFAKEAAALGAFYAELFGWTMQPLPEIRYVLIDTCAGAGISGGILTVSDRRLPPMFYVAVDDLPGTLQRVVDAGGAVTLSPITEVVTFAQCADPEGRTVGVLQRGDESAVSSGDAPPVSRFHMSSIDPRALANFYESVFAWRIHPSRADEGAPAFDVETGPGGIGGTIGGTFPQSSPVTFCASVPDAGAYLERARALGASCNGRAPRGFPSTAPAYFVDPEGNGFGLLATELPG